ncbi:HD domain-containing protein [Marinibactrum halimedae]|uniref:Phosphohydrolase n=1 Tax=Marinibactrum halimedae TaxID=1444977 RepID=A0AA37T5K9_9GAMM|nr:HD domain-containing protein [Marinibactrum halimedae]MCD9458861.1 HD domain-containing protein [Marinibactrum halimedae]GLS27713.1 phosphohydrolase [Marinibactrum halimedae]
MNDLSQQLQFINEMDKLKAVYRRALIKADNNRRENSAEHSWHIALTAHVLAPYAEEPIDVGRVTLMLLLHDIVEIDAGDTFAFDDSAILAEQSDKEIAAAKRLFGLLPPSQAERFISLWMEFEEAETPDASFAKAMDRVLPLMQNIQNNGGSWAANTVKKSQVINRNRHLERSAPKLWGFVLEEIEKATEKGWLQDT